MKTTSTSKKSKSAKTTTAIKRPDEASREDRIAATRAYLESTREQFLINLTKAKAQLCEVETGVLAGPIARKSKKTH